MIDTELVVRAVHDVARALGRPAALPVLSDARFGEAEMAREIVEAASYHAVLPMLRDATERQAGVPEAVRAAVHDEHLRLVARGLRLHHLTRVATDALADAGIPHAIYKGAALARYYPAAELRVFADVDLLLNRADARRADEVLRAAGLAGGWDGVPADYSETTYVLSGHGTLDVHWHVMREPNVRAGFRLDTADMLARVSRVDLAGTPAPVLDPVDELLSAATHACFDGAYRLGWLVDVAQLVTSPDLDRTEFRRRAARTGTALPAQVIFDRMQRALDVDAPQLASGAWRRGLDALSGARPVERTFRQAGRGGLAYRATRATTWRSVIALSGLVFTDGVRPLITDPQHRWRRGRTARI